MADEPIRIGSTSLVPDQGSQISTNDFGMQRGTARHWIGDQSDAQSSRFALGASYSGSLPQFIGFYVDKSGDITGLDGKCAYLDVGYARIDPLWQKLAKVGRDLELKQIKVAETTGFGSLYDSLLTYVVPIGHPTVTYKYSASSIPGQLGSYSSNAGGGGVPSIGNYVFHFNTVDFSNPSVQIQQKTLSTTVTAYIIYQNGTCTTSTSTSTATVTGIFTQNQLDAINLYDFVFSPDPRGWLCLKEDCNPVANATLYEIEQSWKLTMLFNGTQQGTWWRGGRIVHCT